MPSTPTTLVPLDMRRLAPGEQEAIRERVVRAVLQNGLTQTAAAALFGMSRASVNTWVGKVAKKGVDALKIGRRGAKPGDRASLAPLQCARIVTIIRGNCLNQLKFPFALWTREAVQAREPSANPQHDNLIPE